MNIIEKLKETVEYRVRKNYLFSLGKLMRDYFKDGWHIERFNHQDDGEYITFVRESNTKL